MLFFIAMCILLLLRCVSSIHSYSVAADASPRPDGAYGVQLVVDYKGKVFMARAILCGFLKFIVA